MPHTFSRKPPADSPAPTKPVFYRLMIPLSITALLLITGFTAVLLFFQHQYLAQSNYKIVQDAVKSLDISLSRNAQMLNALTELILDDKTWYETLHSRDRERLLARYAPVFATLQEKYKITHFYFHLPNRINFLRLHKPRVHSDLIDRFTARQAESTQQMSWGIELGPLGTFTLRVVRPIFSAGMLIGYLELGQEIEGLLALMHQRLGVDIAVSIHKKDLLREKWESGMNMLGRDSNWDRYKGEVLIYYTFPHFPKAFDQFLHGEQAHKHDTETDAVQFDNKTWKVFAHSLHDVSGNDVGDLLIFRDISEVETSFFQLVAIALGAAILLLSSLSIFFHKILRRTDHNIMIQQTRLLESENRQRSLLEAVSRSGIYLFVVDENYAIRYMNEAMRSSFGTIEGKLCYKQVNNLDSPCKHCRLPEVIGNQEIVHYQSTLANDRSYEMIAVPFVDIDGTPCKLEVMKDISEQLQMKHEKELLEQKLQRAQKMEAVGMLAGGVAHDLNNILSGIVAYPELLLLKLPEDSVFRTPLQEIQKSGKRAAAVVADLLTVARGAASTKEPHNLHALIKSYLDSPEYKKLMSVYPKVTCRQQLNASHPFLSCSSLHIRKSLMNLITNAVEAVTEKGTVIIASHNTLLDNAEARSLQLPVGEYIVLTIRDTGAGITKEDTEHIFEPFYTKKTMGQSGTGLGLTVVWNTIQDHDGKISVESSEKGTCFTLYFPASPVEGMKEALEDKPEEALLGNGEHILVVDDEPQLRDIATRMLDLLGYRTASVSSGRQAIEYVQKQPVDLIVLDMLMEPGINGRETYERITTLYPAQRAVIVSGFSESNDVKKTMQLGPVSFIKKPYSLEQLGRIVKERLHTNSQ